jgi:hypothetical protein
MTPPERFSRNTQAVEEGKGEFVYHMATWDFREVVNRSAVTVPPEIADTHPPLMACQKMDSSRSQTGGCR